MYRVGVKIEQFDGALRQLASDMVEAMHAHGGIGLAAQQVGQALQLAVIDMREAESDFAWEFDGARPPLELFMPLTLANPVVAVAPGTPEVVYEEGCLSFPKIRGDIRRPERVTVQFQDEHGVPHTLTCDGLLARCVQHEVDHINGILFIERMDKKVRASVDDAVKTLAKETRAAARKT